MATVGESQLDLHGLGVVVATLAAVFGLLAVYVAVPAMLAGLLGVRVERILLGAGFTVLSYRSGRLEWVLGCLPVGAAVKLFGDEGMQGVPPRDWSGSRDPDDDPDDDEPADDDDEDDAAAEPPPADSFMAAHPLVRAGLALSGPGAVMLLGIALLGAAQAADGPQLTLAARSRLPASVRENPSAAPWAELPLFDDWAAVPDVWMPEGAPAPRPLPDYPLAAAAAVVRFAVLSASPDGFSAYLGWPMLLVRSFEIGPAFCLAMFGLFACLIASVNLLPLPTFNGGVALLAVMEWTLGLRLRRSVAEPVNWLGYVWFLLLLLQVVWVDFGRWLR
jgi:membrane-associated protease RseP (regulator of RpoE activity)